MKTLKKLSAIIVCAFLFSGCVYNFLVPEEVAPPIDPEGPQISFASEIAPIFSDGNKCTACHNGGQNPDLTAANAYNSINKPAYINKATPEESGIYLHPNPTTDTHKQKKYTSAEAALILGWITQGAKNN